LGDLRQLCERAGVDVVGAPWIDRDASELRRALPAVTAAVQAIWDVVRADDAPAPTRSDTAHR
jgi:hypothetical protein